MGYGKLWGKTLDFYDCDGSRKRRKIDNGVCYHVKEIRKYKLSKLTCHSVRFCFKIFSVSFIYLANG